MGGKRSENRNRLYSYKHFFIPLWAFWCYHKEKPYNPFGEHGANAKRCELGLVSMDKMVGGVEGQVFALFVLTVAAAEVAIGLGLVVAIFRLRGYEGSSEITQLRD